MKYSNATAYKFLFITVFIFCGLIIQAQYKSGSLGNGIIPQIVPPSPEAGSLGKYGDWPVSQYTGIPSITVPIYTINVNGFQLPVQLSYHAGGVKLDEVSSWTGTNWTLNAGGSISRTVVGLPDEEPGTGFLYQNQRALGLKSSYDLNNTGDYATLSKIADGLMDGEPDLFYYNFGGLSGKFYFDKAGNFQTVPAANLKLIKCPVNNTLNPTSDKHWEVADASGNVYYFGSYQDNDKGFEVTGMIDNTNARRYTTSWYLTKIGLANSADTIYFDYTDKYESYDLPPTQSFRVLTNTEPLNYQYGDLTQGPAPDPLKVNQVLTNGAVSGVVSGSFAVSGKAMLQKIRWRGGELQFVTTTIRQDISTGKMLDVISLFDKAGVKTKNYLLKYLYTQKRYFLQSVTESDASATSQVAHKFDYLQPAALPIRGSTGFNSSFAQDHWGFYNGANSNTNLLPANTDIANGSLTANREPSEAYMGYGTLSRITYPTGGYTDFEFEAHRYDPTSPVNGGPSSAIAQYGVGATAANPQPAGIARIQNFTVSFAQKNCAISLQFKNYAKPASKEQGWLPLIRIEKLVSGAYQSVYSWNAYDQFPVGNVPAPNQYGLIDYNLNLLLSFSAGDYRIVTDLVCGIANCGTPANYPSVVSQLIYFKYTGALPIAGGLRIKQITSYTGTGLFASRKKYVYDPGKLLIYPKYEHQYGEYIWPAVYIPHAPGTTDPKSVTPCFPLYAKFKEITSTSQALLGFTQGAAVGYTFVKEQDVTSTGDDNGYTAYAYTYTGDVLNQMQYDNFYWPGFTILNAAMPLNNLDYKRGLLQTKEIFKKNKGANNVVTYVRIYSLVNNYNFSDGDINNRYNTLTGMRVKKLISFPMGGACGTTVNGYMVPTVSIPNGGSLASLAPSYAFYNLITGWAKLMSTTENTYDPTGANPVTLTTNYTYGNTVHMQATSSTITDSRNHTIKTDLKYPHDFSTTAPYNTMITKNIIVPVVEQTQTDVTLSKELSKTKVNYQAWQSNTLFKPVSSQRSVLASPLETEATINAYDNRGNILQVTDKDGIITSYFWGYNQQYPVAKIQAKTYADIIAQSGINMAVLGDISSPQVAVLAELNKLRTLSGCFVSTYTYKMLTGTLCETDPNGRSVYYSYDALGRLVLVRDQDKNIIKKICYNYAGQAEACSLFGNLVKTGSYQKSCVAGFSGSSVIYTVPANTYFSATQTDADKQAQDAVAANGQAYANLNGTCTVNLIYARITYTDWYYDVTETYATPWIKFYSDAACTIPLPVNNLTVNYKKVKTTCGGGSPITSNFSINCTGSQTSLGPQLRVTDDEIHCWNYDFSVTTGTGYINL